MCAEVGGACRVLGGSAYNILISKPESKKPSEDPGVRENNGF